MTEPIWLTKARGYIGFHEEGNNRGIESFIALAHCGQVGDPWCAIFANACLESVGIRGTRSPAAASFTEDGNFAATAPQLGAIVTFRRTGGNHVGFYMGRDAQGLLVLGGNQSDQVCIEHHADNPTGYWWPRSAQIDTKPDEPADTHPLIKLGSTGAAVLELQRLLGFMGSDLDGDFGEQTDTAVRVYQAAHGLVVDGEVGPLTWLALYSKPIDVPGVTLPQSTIDQIVSLARNSVLARYEWKDRGRAPIGYINGMAVTFARALLKLKAGDSATRAMTIGVGVTDVDALAWYGYTDAAFLDRAGVLRKLFALLYGLGMRELSGNCFEGRDMSASNKSPDTAESGLFQQSWDSHAASPELPKLLAAYRGAKQEGYLSIFREGVTGAVPPSSGTSDGDTFQTFAKAYSAFAVESAAVGLRVLRKHWGPINRKEAEVRPEAEQLLLQIQSIVDAQSAKQGATVTEPATVPQEQERPPQPQLQPQTLPGMPLPQIDVLQGLHYIVEGPAQKVRADLKMFLDVFNAKYAHIPEIPIALPPAPPPPVPDGTPIHRTPAFQVGAIGVVISTIVHQMHMVDPDMTIAAGIISAACAFLGPAGGIVATVATNLGRAAWKSMPDQAQQNQAPPK